MASADRLIEVFTEAKARPAGAERERFLAGACPGDPVLKEQVISLLRAHDGAGDFLKNSIPAPAGLLTEKPGDRIGRYKLLEQIGEGGCGVVYMAEQEEPVRRRVALKVIKLGMDTKQVIARFEAERQALALMDHPNIAKVFDAGLTEHPLTPTLSPSDGAREKKPRTEPPLPVGRGEGQGEESANSQPSTPNPQLSPGRLYFVMELVRGIKITDFCAENKLSTVDRLKLFIQVCQAIQHAHQKGVIHRDIKPSNILVTVNDGVSVPKVIDFGIAKATQGRLTDHTLFTAFEQFIGTPAYMSPEQAVMTSLDIDTRSDIYSLGVLLYELLTGRTPFDQKELLAAGLDEMRRTIREVEPVKPSTRLTQDLVEADVRRLQSTSPQSAAINPQRLKELIHLLRGDLDWIAMKCLEKDRARRYETANSLAADIQRHLNNEPVIARPPSRVYRFQKSVQRNKLAFAAASAVVAALVIGLTISTVMFFRERATYRRALVAERRAEQSRGEEVSLQLRILDIMDEIEHHGPDTEADKLLTEGMNWAIASKAQRAQVLQLRATVFARRGRWNEAAADFKNSLEADPETTYQSAWRCYLVGTILAQCNQLDAYREHCHQSLQRFRTTTDPVSAERIAKVCLLSSSAGVDLEAVARMTDTATNQMYVAWAHLAKGLAEYRQGHFVSAGEWVQETLDDNLGGSDRDHRLVEAYMVLAMANYQLRQMDNARAAFTKGVQIEQTKLAKIESGDLSPDWMDWIITQTLMREAKALIEGQPANAPEMKSEAR